MDSFTIENTLHLIKLCAKRCMSDPDSSKFAALEVIYQHCVDAERNAEQSGAPNIDTAEFTSDPEPNPCPHCGHSWVRTIYRIAQAFHQRVFFVQCPNCGARGPEESARDSNWRDCEEAPLRAIRAWNKRCRRCEILEKGRVSIQKDQGHQMALAACSNSLERTLEMVNKVLADAISASQKKEQ